MSMQTEEEVPAFVIDLGSRSVKAGYSGDPVPRIVFPTVIAKKSSTGRRAALKKPLVGHQAIANRASVTLTAPVQNSVIQDWDDMETLINHAFIEGLKHNEDDMREFPVLMAEPASHATETDYFKNREKMAEVMFEKFEVPAWYLAMTPVLSLLSQGKTTGVAVESGFDCTTTVPVYEGHALRHGIRKMEYAGADTTEYLMTLINDQEGMKLRGREDLAVVQKIKHTFARVALNYEKELQKCEEQEFTTPDGKVIKVQAEAIQCTEPLFDPTTIEMGGESLQECVNNSILASDRDIQEILFNNIYLAGGNSFLPGMSERLTSELRQIAPLATPIGVKPLAFDERQGEEKRDFSAWQGGAMLAASEAFEDMWVSKQEYDEFGKFIVHASCF